MIIFLKHPINGVKDCYHEAEALADIRNGWELVKQADFNSADLVESLPAFDAHYTKPADEAIDEDTIELYRLKFGKPPHHRMKLDTILAAINDNGK